MNQILDYGGGNGDNGGKPKKNKNNNNNYNGNFGGGSSFNGGSNDGGKLPMSDKIIKVFAICMVILAIGLIFSGVTSIFKNKKESDKSNTNTTQKVEVKADIQAELDEISGKVKITIDSPVTISKVIYSWDKEHENIVAGEKQTSLELEVIASYGEHVLHVQVTDEQNNKTTKDFTFDSPTGIDTTQPNVVLTVTEEKKLLIKATDDTSIAYVTYKWTDEAGNEGETVTMTPEEEGAKEYEFEIEIPRGKNTIVVYAVDGSDSANAKTATKVLEGITKAVIKSCEYLDPERKQVQIVCTHEVGIKSIFYTLNGNNFNWEVPEGETYPELAFVIDSVVGENNLSLVITSVDGAESEFNATWTYEGDQPSSDAGSEEQPEEQTEEQVGEEEILGSDETEQMN